MIENYRKKHIFAVAELMQKYGKDRNFTDEQCKELYVLGLLHDVGYEFLEKKDFKTHNVAGGGFLKSQGYKFWKEVYFHGVVSSPYQSVDQQKVPQKLLQSEKVVCTYHRAFDTNQSETNRINLCIDNIEAFFKGEPINTI